MEVFIVLNGLYGKKDSECEVLGTFSSYQQAVNFGNEKCKGFYGEDWKIKKDFLENMKSIEFYDKEKYHKFEVISQKVIEDNIKSNIIENIKNVKSKSVLKALKFITSNDQNIQLFKDLIRAALFFTVNHSVHDCKTCEEVGGCDDCYSGDTEFEYDLKIKDKARELFKFMLDENDDAEDSIDENDENYMSPHEIIEKEYSK